MQLALQSITIIEIERKTKLIYRKIIFNNNINN